MGFIGPGDKDKTKRIKIKFDTAKGLKTSEECVLTDSDFYLKHISLLKNRPSNQMLFLFIRLGSTFCKKNF